MNSGTIDSYRLGKTLGSGYSAKVKLAVDDDGTHFKSQKFGTGHTS